MENMLHSYLRAEIPWQGRDWGCPGNSSTSWRPTDDLLLLEHLSQHEREPPDSCNGHVGVKTCLWPSRQVKKRGCTLRALGGMLISHTLAFEPVGG